MKLFVSIFNTLRHQRLIFRHLCFSAHFKFNGAITWALHTDTHSKIPRDLIKFLEIWVIDANLLMLNTMITHVVDSLGADVKLPNDISFEESFIFCAKSDERINQFLPFQIFEFEK